MYMNVIKMPQNYLNGNINNVATSTSIAIATTTATVATKTKNSSNY